ncbi:MAG: GTP cyclohydrolase I, partial [Bacteroidota bacterium]
VIGLSKINRLVHYFARRPQVQERLTKQIAEGLQEALQTKDVAVIVDAAHLCVSMRGVQDHGGTTITASYSGVFEQEHVRSEFLKYLEIGKNS